MDDVDRLVGQFRQHQISAETLVRRLAAIRRAEHERQTIDLAEVERSTTARVPQAAIGSRERSGGGSSLIPDVDLDGEAVPVSIQRAKETLRRLNQYR
jgi:hypothetical protein